MSPSDKGRLHIASLGSSFAAGPGIPPQVERHAMRSGNNYPSLVARELNASLTDLTVSGATLLNITTEPQLAPSGDYVFPPQILALPEDVDYVFVTGGGNDMSYIGNMIDDALRASDGPDIPQTPTAIPPEELPQRMGETLDAIHQKAPNARVFFVEYLALLGPATKAAVHVPFNQERVDHHSGVASALQNAYAVAAEPRPWCERVPIHELSADHVLGSEEPWVEGFSMESLQRGNPFHPNLAGMKGVAKILLARVTEAASTKL